MSERRTEVWANGERWRTITVFRLTNDVQYSWGRFDKPVDYFVKMYSGNLSAAMDGSWGAGHELWYQFRSAEKKIARIENIRKSAAAAGFKSLGVI